MKKTAKVSPGVDDPQTNADSAMLKSQRGSTIELIGASTLWIACSQNDFKSVQQLIESNSVEVTKKDFNNRSPLWISCYKGHDKIVKFLLDNGAQADLNSGDVWEDRQPLFIAVSQDHFEIASMLIDAGAHVDVPNRDGVTPLITACYNNNYKMVTLLVQKGANPLMTDKVGNSAAQICAKYGRKDLSTVIRAAENKMTKTQMSRAGRKLTAVIKTAVLSSRLTLHHKTPPLSTVNSEHNSPPGSQPSTGRRRSSLAGGLMSNENVDSEADEDEEEEDGFSNVGGGGGGRGSSAGLLGIGGGRGGGASSPPPALRRPQSTGDFNPSSLH